MKAIVILVYKPFNIAKSLAKLHIHDLIKVFCGRASTLMILVLLIYHKKKAYEAIVMKRLLHTL